MADINVSGRVTLYKRAEVEIIEKKSRFIGRATPVRSEAEAAEFVSEMKKKYADATHNVYAYYINGGAVARCSDDGEPQGSSGYPTLNALKTCGASDLCVVVTRYFGGTLLGTAGLARAYAAAARAAIEAAGFAVYEKFTVVMIEIGYSEYQKLTVLLKNEGIPEEDTDFGEFVTVTCAMMDDKLEKIASSVRDMTGGKGKFEIICEEERLRPLVDKK
ncbi:MAG: YigZ family protein [Clostridia bacterium]|nr:YigZ family protein [Clostridia bacterium]